MPVVVAALEALRTKEKEKNPRLREKKGRSRSGSTSTRDNIVRGGKKKGGRGGKGGSCLICARERERNRRGKRRHPGRYPTGWPRKKREGRRVSSSSLQLQQGEKGKISSTTS